MFAALGGRGRGERTRWALIAWCAVIVAQDIVAMMLGRKGINNLWIVYVGQPLLSVTLLWALSEWHRHRSAQLALKAAIPLVIVVSVALTFAVDDPRNFSLVAAPFHSIVMLLAAIWTFLALGLKAESAVHRESWFWIIGGVILYAATSTAMQPIAWYLIRERVDLLHAAFNVRAAIVLLSFGAITWGMLPRGTPTYSGGSSSPPSSPSSSW